MNWSSNIKRLEAELEILKEQDIIKRKWEFKLRNKETDDKCYICGGHRDHWHHLDSFSYYYGNNEVIPLCIDCHLCVHARYRDNVEKITDGQDVECYGLREKVEQRWHFIICSRALKLIDEMKKKESNHV